MYITERKCSFNKSLSNKHYRRYVIKKSTELPLVWIVRFLVEENSQGWIDR